MFRFIPARGGSKSDLHAGLRDAALAITDGERDAVANMANLAALLWQFLPDLNWAGFYRRIGDELVLGPFAGKPACVRIPVGGGVCGRAAAEGTTQIVPDVDAFPGHIACDSRSASEIVVPVFDAAGALIAVFDVDGTTPAAFDEVDQAALEQLLGKVFGA